MGTSTAGGMVAGPAAGQPPARPRPFGFARFLLFQSPYILMLLLVLGGITYRAFIGHPIVGYWIMLMPAFCVLCIIGGLRHTKSTKEIVELVLTQVVQWAVFLAALFVLTLGPVRSMLDDDAAALLQLTMLAVATILAGMTARSWRVALVGLLLLVAVPVISWIDMSTSLIFVGMVTLVIVVVIFWVTERRLFRRQAAAAT